MTGSDAVGCDQPGLQKRLLSAVKRRGAVSPATRARESRRPVAIPRAAAGMTTRTIMTDDSWLVGPPYAVAEEVFDEHSIEGCSLSPDADDE